MISKKMPPTHATPMFEQHLPPAHVLNALPPLCDYVPVTPPTPTEDADPPASPKKNKARQLPESFNKYSLIKTYYSYEPLEEILEEDMQDIVDELKEAIHERSTETRKETGPNFEGNTPSSSQQSLYSVDEDVKPDKVMGFILEKIAPELLHKELQDLKFLPKTPFDPQNFDTVAWSILKNEPEVLLDVLERALERNSSAKKAKFTHEEEEVMVRADYPDLP